MKQVVGVKPQLKDAVGFAKPGMPADSEGFVEGDSWLAKVFKVTARKVIAVGGKGSNGEGWPPSSGAASPNFCWHNPPELQTFGEGAKPSGSPA